MKFLFDFFPVLLFFAAYKFYGIYEATAVAIAASFVQVGAYWLKHRRFENMHLVTLGLVALLGGATLVLQDETFIMWKPTVVNWLFGAVFLGSQFIGERPLVERMMRSAISLPALIWRRLNMTWAVFFIALGFINLYVAFYYGLELPHEERMDIWVDFKLFGMMGLTFAFILLQGFYLARHVKPEEQPSDS
jgi:intracellular septation protein